MTFSRDVQIGPHRAVMTLSDMGELCVSWGRLPGDLTEDERVQYFYHRDRLVNELAPALSRNHCLAIPFLGSASV